MKTFTSHNRPREVLDSILQNDATLSKEQRAAKYAKMSVSPYRFFRGTNHLFWQDFFRDWHFALFGGVPECQTWIQGDAHVYNFGAFGNENGEIIYGMDDFDDSIIADYQYDLWRLAISTCLDCRENGFFSTGKIQKAIRSLAKGYLKEATAPNHGQTQAKPLKRFLKIVKRKAHRHELLEKWTDSANGKRTFRIEKEKLAAMPSDEQEKLAQALEKHLVNFQHPESPSRFHFRIKDAAYRLEAGTGSLGVLRIYALIEGSGHRANDDVILDIKEQTPPQVCREMSWSELQEYQECFPDEGQRHARAFRAISRRPDRYLGWMSWEGKQFSIRERSVYKEDFPTDETRKFKHYRAMARQWGRLLARGHVRGAADLGPEQRQAFTLHIKGIRKKRKREFLSFLQALAGSYADCVEQDFGTFLSEINLLVEGRPHSINHQ
ncbi:MAG: hypothetical protein CMF59_04300 [Leptospiraceae bacterium]|nr:hypothetical protein [Leptospiraceae bacterium]